MRKRDVLREFSVSFSCLLGPFGSLFRIFPHYGPFLNLEQDDDIDSPVTLALSLKKMNAIFQSKSTHQINKGVIVLLNSINWRNHLVACIAIIKMNQENQIAYYDKLWDLYLNKTSWIVPQILATLSIIDPDFSTKIKKKESEQLLSNDKLLAKEVEFLLSPKGNKSYKDEAPIYGLPWKNNLIELIKEGKL